MLFFFFQNFGADEIFGPPPEKKNIGVPRNFRKKKKSMFLGA